MGRKAERRAMRAEWAQVMREVGARAERRAHGEALLRQGLRDAEVGRQVGVTREAVRIWRRALGLPPLSKRNPQTDFIDALLLSNPRISDQEIFELIGARTSAVPTRRIALGLGPSPNRRVDLVGRVFGRLTALEIDWSRTDGAPTAYWRCRCACGQEASVRRGLLISGWTSSCGCLRNQRGPSRGS